MPLEMNDNEKTACRRVFTQEDIKRYRVVANKAEHGDADSQYFLGYMYQYGYVVDKDYTEAVKWYRKAAEQGDADAQIRVGGMCQHGYGVVQDYTEA